MRVCLRALTFSLITGFIAAVSLNEDDMHYITSARQTPPLNPFQHQAIKSTGLPQIWKHFDNNPFLAYNTYDRDAEFFPESRNLQRSQVSTQDDNPFDVEVVTTDVEGGASPGVFIQQSFPFLGSNIFNSFGEFGFGGRPQQVPWWIGPNVCTEKEEIDEEKEAEVTEKPSETEFQSSDTLEVHPPLFRQFHISVDSCIEKTHKYVCTKVLNRNGKKQTLKVTRQCCYGYGRPRNAHVAMLCDKIEIKSIERTAKDIGAELFLANAKTIHVNDSIVNLKNVTVFMPLDDEFRRFNDQLLNEKNMVESKTDDKSRNMFLRHLVSGKVNLDDVTNEQLLETKLSGQSVRINAYQVPEVLAPEPLQYTANCVPIEKRDIPTEQGLVHSIRGVMKPVTKNVMDVIRQRSDTSIMRTILEKTKLSKLLEMEKSVTVFVPNNAAFDKLEQHLRRALKEGKGCAANILRNHILYLTFCSVASISGAKTTVHNILGETMRFNRNSTSSTDKSDVSDMLKLSQSIVINGIAKLIEEDLMGTNGVVHVIDTILPTYSALPLSTLMQKQNATLFKKLLEAAGVINKFDDMDNIAIFAPTDKALEGTKWIQTLSESPEKLSNDPELLEVINYHIATPMIKTCDLTEKLLPTLSDKSVRINLYSTQPLFSNVMNRATVNCARLLHFDNESCGSVLHQVDKVLSPPKKSLLELLESESNYSKFLELVKLANLTELLKDPDESYTVLVPKNDVFEEMDDWKKTLTKDHTELVDLVKTHIVNDVVCCAGIIPTNWPFVRTIKALNGSHLHITRNRRPRIENVGVTKCDSIATNGIIHEINDFIVLKNRQQGQQSGALKYPIEKFGTFFV